MIHPITMQALAKTIQDDRLKAADQYRLEMQARAGQPSLASRFFKGMGILLTAAGKRFQTQKSARTLEWAEESNL